MSRDATQEEIEAAALVNEETVLGFGDEIDFMQLFRCKGKKGLFTLRSQVNKAGIVGIIGFMDYNRKFTVKANDLICLGQLSFQREAGFEDLRMNDVFNNLFDYCNPKGGLEKDINKLFIDNLIDVMVPNYDPDKFKRYHAEMVWNWYKEVFNKLKEMEVKEDVKKVDKGEDKEAI